MPAEPCAVETRAVVAESVPIAHIYIKYSRALYLDAPGAAVAAVAHLENGSVRLPINVPDQSFAIRRQLLANTWDRSKHVPALHHCFRRKYLEQLPNKLDNSHYRLVRESVSKTRTRMLFGKPKSAPGLPL